MARVWQIIQYCLAGASGVIIYYAALYGLTEYLGVWYVVSAIIGFILNTGLSFVLQKFWTFQDKTSRKVGHQLAQYATMKTLFLVANTVLLYLMVEYLHLWYMAAQVMLTVLLTVVGFIVSNRIFRNK